jgi:hypothetical protein
MSRPGGVVAALLLVAGALVSAGCVLVPVGRPVAAAPAVVVPAPPVVVAPAPAYRVHRGYWRGYGRHW